MPCSAILRRSCVRAVAAIPRLSALAAPARQRWSIQVLAESRTRDFRGLSSCAAPEPGSSERAVINFVLNALEDVDRHELPAVTLTFAQSLDGCIAGRGAERIMLSGPASLAMTHQLRTMHDAILIGVGTLLADDPRLTARLVVGTDPLPVVLDSELRTPVTSRLVLAAAERQAAGKTGLVVMTANASSEKALHLQSRPGVEVVEAPTTSQGRLSVTDVLASLKQRFNCGSVMVEGGMAVIASFLASPHLVHNLVVTISPRFLGGRGPSAELGKVQSLGQSSSHVDLAKMHSCHMGDDLVVYGALLPTKQLSLNGANGKHPAPAKVNGHSASKAASVSSASGNCTALKSECRMWVAAIDAECKLQVYTAPGGKEIVALIKGDVDGAEMVPARVHSECFTGDVLGSKRCDCGPQLQSFLDVLQTETRGVLLYIRGDEGRGIGLVDKIRAYELQEKGLDTVDANLSLGLAADLRTFDSSKEVIESLRIKSIKLYTNNPEKVHALRVLTSEVCPLNCVPNEHNMSYLQTKHERLNHRTILAEVAA
eukprot:gb/GFBE01008037.1/.p1 GENE.gb/GFBE01008037.1/~~gb/GFBE01008037.1/.p1  ORF type:complete len:542 (+),score=114.35 gb/GFBE01008037.1/:1-1626(+)